MSFFHDMRAIVLRHGAVNNSYLTRFRRGDLTEEEFRRFALEFYNFARFFPKILVSQLINTEDETVADELTKVLYSELGEGQAKNRHELLFRNFLRSVGIDIHEAISRPMLPSTQDYIEGMERLYGSRNHARALGASFGLENMAISMWDHLLPGLAHLRKARYPAMDMTYFQFHRELEGTHEEAMKKAVAAMEGSDEAGHTALSASEQEEFREGMVAVLDYLEGFWLGLERPISSPALV